MWPLQSRCPIFFGLLGDELAEISGRAGKHRAAEIGELRLEVSICNKSRAGRV
jgi:hypothetical protein